VIPEFFVVSEVQQRMGSESELDVITLSPLPSKAAFGASSASDAL
jgi:hypothetical protein